MVLVINGESYGALHKTFFFLAGVSTSLFWGTFYSKFANHTDERFMESFLVDRKFEMQGLFIAPVIVAFLTYNHYRRFFSFINQMRVSLLIMLVLSSVFYLIMMGVLNSKQGGWKLVKYMVVGAQLTFTILYVISTVRYVFNFTMIEIANFLIGYYTSFAGNFSILYFLKSLDLKISTYCWIYFGINAIAYLLTWMVTEFYYKTYINRADDLFCETDTLRRLIRESNDKVSFRGHLAVAKKIFFPLSLVMFNSSMNSMGFTFFTNEQIERFGDTQELKYLGMALRNCSNFAGVLIMLAFKDDTLYIGFMVSFVRLVVLVVLAGSAIQDKKLLESEFYWALFIILYYLLDGFVHVSSICSTRIMTSEKDRNIAGYLLCLCICMGSVYGSIAASFSFFE